MNSYTWKRQLIFCLRKSHNGEHIQIRKGSAFTRVKEVSDCDNALQYFDVSYRSVFGSQWPSIRLALLSKRKHVALVNNYSPDFDENVDKLKLLGCMDVGAKYLANCEELTTAKQQSIADGHTTRDQDTTTGGAQHWKYPKRPTKELTDDEKAERLSAARPDRYPDQYKDLGDTPQEYFEQVPTESRVILPHKHASPELMAQSLQDFVPATSLKGLPELCDDQDIFTKFAISTPPGEGPGVNIKQNDDFLKWPNMLSAFAFPQGDISRFPKTSYTYDISNYYLMDGGSLLPVLLLGLEEQDRVLDMCAGPGGKTLAMLQTCMPGYLQSNDSNLSRSIRIKDVLKQFYCNKSTLARNTEVTFSDGRSITGKAGRFDKVLVDVPCLCDRHSLVQHDDNIFSKGRTRERLEMPELQAELLVAALHHVRVGGTVVYSTCTLAPVQNDGVVHLALNRLWDSSNLQCRVVDFSAALEPFNFLFKFGCDIGLRYGQVVLPYLPNNYGPTYCAKLVRTR